MPPQNDNNAMAHNDGKKTATTGTKPTGMGATIKKLRGAVKRYNEAFPHAQIDVDTIPDDKWHGFASILGGYTQLYVLGLMSRAYPKIDEHASTKDRKNHNDTLGDNGVLVCKFKTSDVAQLQDGFFYQRENMRVYLDENPDTPNDQREIHGRMLKRSEKLFNRFYWLRKLVDMQGVKYDKLD